MNVDMEQMDSLFKLTHNIPKIELHAHIGGCYRPQTFMDLCLQKNLDIDHIDFYNVNIATAFEIFKVGSKLITDAATLRRVTTEIIEDYAKQNTRYLELRSTPKSVGAISTKEEYINIVLEAMSEMEKQIPSMKVAYLVSINRAHTDADAKEAIDLLIKVKAES